MIPGPSIFRKFMPGMISGFSIIRKYILEFLTEYLSYGYLRMCFYIAWQHFANMVSPGKMTITARTASKFCARNWSQCSHIFSWPDILVNSWKYRTLAKMSTWMTPTTTATAATTASATTCQQHFHAGRSQRASRTGIKYLVQVSLTLICIYIYMYR